MGADEHYAGICRERKVDSMLEKVFKLSENKTNVKTEIIAGVTTFMTMANIIALNPNL